ncbi:MAG: murein biosynthesis integral membrane protein MurJ [Puniceicoccales bacterium]|jgi:putative peptidoglycan lipid II flippase|nr:murein biosynthesis integral membrane protein MurJ [Puniceicoccales bacterium]
MGVLNNIFIVAIITLSSRIFGLWRDILTFTALGTGIENSAFIFAFTLPNLFRRLFGEGALTSALVPVFSDEFHKNSLQSAFSLLNKTVTRVALILLGIVASGMLIIGVFFALGLDQIGNRWRYSLNFSALLLPYMIFVCLAAIFSAVLNVLGQYFLSSMNAIWLNVSMIVFFYISGYYCQYGLVSRIYWLCAGVLAGGVVQLMLPVIQLYKLGWRVKFDLGTSPQFHRLKQLFIPGFVGASIMQVNIAVSRWLAFGLSNSAMSILYLANRLMELPLGVFVVAITTVMFPNMSKFASKNDRARLSAAFQRGANMIIAIVLPAALGIIVLRSEIFIVLFKYGNFGLDDMLDTLPVVYVFMIAMVFYALSTFFVRGFHVMKNTKIPVYISLVSFIVNFIATLILMKPYGVKGVAMANLLSVVVQTVLLYLFLIRIDHLFRLKNLYDTLSTVIFSCLIMSTVVVFCCTWLKNAVCSEKLYGVLSILVGVPVGVGSYLVSLYLLGFKKILTKP